MGISTALTVPTGAKAQRTYQSLMAATRAVITDTGRFSGESVAEHAGVAPATFYAYFPSKDEALAAALDQVLTDAVEDTLRELDVVRLLDEGLRPVLERAVTAALGVFSGSARVLSLALARIPESRTIRQIYRDHQAHALTEVERFITRGVAAGQIHAEDPRATTIAVLVTLQGLNNPLLTGAVRDAQVVPLLLVDMLESLLTPAGRQVPSRATSK